MRHEIVWQAPEATGITVEGEGSSPFRITAMPVVTVYPFGVTVGLYYHGPNSIGHWKSSNVTDAITAWRAAQLLPKLRTIRSGGGSYDETVTGLVIAFRGDRNEDRLRALAKDFGITTEELLRELRSMSRRWPSAEAVTGMWDRLPAGEQNSLVSDVREAIASGSVSSIPALEDRLRIAEDRIRMAAEQKAREDQLIEDGLAPYLSLRQFLEDIGVSNLVYTLGFGEMFDPTHFKWADLDREVMRELIGERGYASRVMLITSALQPDDPDAHHSEGGGGISVYWSNFGESGHPRIQLDGEEFELISVGWDNVQHQFALTLRPVGLSERDDSRDESMTVTELRTRIGTDHGLDRPLQVGEAPAWARRSAPPVPQVKRRRRFGWPR